MFISNSNFLNFLKKKKIIKNFDKKSLILLKVLQIGKKYIIFEGGLKSECFLKVKDFLENNSIQVEIGDYIEIFLKNIENNYNRIILSRFKVKNYFFWKNVAIIHNNKKLFIKGKVFKKIKGGYSIIIMNDFKCFLPFSCSDKRMINMDYFFNKYLYFSILNFDFLKKNIILSRKVVIYEVCKLKRKIFFKKIKVGSLIKGVIRNITNYCLFVDIGYLTCVVFFKDLMWGNYRYLNDFLKVGKSIIGIVLKLDYKKKRVFLGMKQIFNPWKKIRRIRTLIKYVRILKLTTNNIYVILCKNFILSTRNKLNKNVFKFLKINKYRKIKIISYNLKKKRLNFKFLKKRRPPLAQRIEQWPSKP